MNLHLVSFMCHSRFKFFKRQPLFDFEWTCVLPVLNTAVWCFQTRRLYLAKARNGRLSRPFIVSWSKCGEFVAVVKIKEVPCQISEKANDPETILFQIGLFQKCVWGHFLCNFTPEKKRGRAQQSCGNCHLKGNNWQHTQQLLPPSVFFLRMEVEDYDFRMKDTFNTGDQCSFKKSCVDSVPGLNSCTVTSYWMVRHFWQQPPNCIAFLLIKNAWSCFYVFPNIVFSCFIAFHFKIVFPFCVFVDCSVLWAFELFKHRINYFT